MTADDMVTVPRELAERLLEHDDLWDVEGKTAQELADLLNPPPEFDPELVEAMAKARHEHTHPLSPRPWNHFDLPRQTWRNKVTVDLTAARDAGWAMVEATELEALRELVAAAWDDVDEAFIAQEMTQAQADAIRQAKAAQR